LIWSKLLATEMQDIDLFDESSPAPAPASMPMPAMGGASQPLPPATAGATLGMGMPMMMRQVTDPTLGAGLPSAPVNLDPFAASPQPAQALTQMPQMLRQVTDPTVQNAVGGSSLDPFAPAPVNNAAQQAAPAVMNFDALVPATAQPVVAAPAAMNFDPLAPATAQPVVAAPAAMNFDPLAPEAGVSTTSDMPATMGFASQEYTLLVDATALGVAGKEKYAVQADSVSTLTAALAQKLSGITEPFVIQVWDADFDEYVNLGDLAKQMGESKGKVRLIKPKPVVTGATAAAGNSGEVDEFGFAPNPVPEFEADFDSLESVGGDDTVVGEELEVVAADVEEVDAEAADSGSAEQTDALINSEFVQVAAGPIPAYEGQILPAALNTCLLRPIAAAAGTIRCYIMIKPRSLFNQYSFYIERNQKSDYAIAFTSAMLYEASRPSRANNMYATILAYEEQRTDWRLAPLPANMGGWQRIFEFAGLYGIAPRETLHEDMLIMTAQDSPKKVIIKDPYGRELGTLE
jgi:hypothetical protein